MAKKNVFEVDDETIEILKQGRIKDNVYYLPDKALDRELYEKVNKVLIALGAKWNRKMKGHIFEYDISNALENVYKEKQVIDWKKETDFYYTPSEIVDEMISLMPLLYNEKLSFLEPSCGQGHIVDEINRLFKNSEVTCVEKNPNHCEFMRKKGYNPICADFLSLEPEEKYDVILMNPPFKEQMEHIKHAYKFLKEGGYLISVAMGNILQYESKTGKEFKNWFKEKDGYCYKLQENSFKKAGTNVNTTLLIFEKAECMEQVA